MSLELSGTTPAIKGVAGSVSAPALTGDDANTGISFPSANTIKFSTGGVERLAISNSGLSGDGSGLSGIDAGITDFDEWRIHTGFNFSGGSLVDANWERNDNKFEKKGTGFSAPSSGVWTFPSTGKWLIRWQANFEAGSVNYAGVYIDATSDNSSYSGIASQYSSIRNTANSFAGTACSAIMDVTSVSTHKIKLYVNSSHTIYCQYDSNAQRTGVQFIKLGAT